MQRVFVFWPKERRFFRRLMLGLLITALIPTTVTVSLLHHHYVSSMTSEIGDSNSKLLEQARMNGDMMLNEMQNAISMLISSPQVGFFMQEEFTSDAKLFNDLMIKLGHMRLDSSYISSIRIYFDNFAYAIGADEINPVYFSKNERFADTQMLGTDAAAKENSDQRRLLLVEKDGGHELYMLRTVRNASYQSVGTIVVTVDSERFESILAPISVSAQDTIAISDKSGAVQWCKGPDCIGQRWSSYSLKSETDSYRTMSKGRESYVVADTSLRNWQWEVTWIVPMKRLLLKVDVFHHLTLFIFFTIVTAALIFSLIYGRYLYKPLRNLLKNIIRAPAGGNRAEAQDEIRLIGQAYDNLLVDNAVMERFIDNNKESMRNKLLSDAVCGQEMNERTIADKLQFLGIAFPNRYFSVIVAEGFRMEAWDDDSYAISTTGKMAVYAESKRLLETMKLTGEAFELNNDMVAIIVNTDVPDAERLECLVQEIRVSTLAYMRSHVSIAAGEYVDRLNKLYESYRKARQQLTYSSAAPGDATSQLPLYEKKIHYALATGHKEGLTDAVDDLMLMLQEQGGYTRTHMLNIWLQVLAAFMKKLEELDIQTYQQLMQRSLYIQAANLDSVQDIREWFDQLFDLALAGLNDTDRHATHNKIELAEQMIRNHYDQELTLELVAEHAGLSSAYFSKLFKDVTGINFIEYLNKIRIEKSKELLRSLPLLPLNEISVQVGYNNTQSFSRFFKKYELCTPGQYRQHVLSEMS